LCKKIAKIQKVKKTKGYYTVKKIGLCHERKSRFVNIIIKENVSTSVIISNLMIILQNQKKLKGREFCLCSK